MNIGMPHWGGCSAEAWEMFKSEHERCYRWYLKVFQIHLTDHHDIILDDPTGPAKIGILRALLDAEQILMYLSTSLKPSKQAVLLDQRLDKIKASLPIANQKRRKCSPRLPWLQGLDAMVVNLLCTPSAPGEQLCLSKILSWSLICLSFCRIFQTYGRKRKKAWWDLAMSAIQQIPALLSRTIQYDLSSEIFPVSP
mgnify:FL=1